eukprot:7894470-Lingulodinium_polyedra.AAC.1
MRNTHRSLSEVQWAYFLTVRPSRSAQLLARVRARGANTAPPRLVRGQCLRRHFWGGGGCDANRLPELEARVPRVVHALSAQQFQPPAFRDGVDIVPFHARFAELRVGCARKAPESAFPNG